MKPGCQLVEVTIEWIGKSLCTSESDQGTNCRYGLWLLQWITRGDESPRMWIQRGYTYGLSPGPWCCHWLPEESRGNNLVKWRSIIWQICTEDQIAWYGHNSCSLLFVNKVYCACCFLSWVVLWVFYRLIGTRSSYWWLPVQKKDYRSSQNLQPGYMNQLAKSAEAVHRKIERVGVFTEAFADACCFVYKHLST